MESSPFKDLPQGTLPYILTVAGIMVAIFLIIYMLYLKNLQDLLKSVRKPNRKMPPSLVWFVLVNFLGLFLVIPELTGNVLPQWAGNAVKIGEYAISIFSLVFNFYMVNKIAESVTAELVSRNVAIQGKPTYAIGIFMCACNTLGLVPPTYLPGLSMAAAGAGFVAWILYWVKTNEYKVKLRSLSQNDQFDF